MINRRVISSNEAKRISNAVKANWDRNKRASDPQERLWHPLVLNTPTTSGENINEKNSLQCMAVYACIKAIAEDIAKIPMYLYQYDKAGKKQKIFNRISNLFLQSPNPEMSAFDFERALTAHVCGWGNGYAEIEFNKLGEAIALWPIPPHIVRVKRDLLGNLYYEIWDNPTEPKRLAPRKIFHVKGLGYDGVVGYSPIQIHRETVGLALAQQKFGAAFYGNGAYPGVMLSHPGSLTKEAQDRLRQSWDEILRSSDKAHRTIILEEGMKPEKMTVNPDDAQYIEGRQFSIEDIARMYRVPPHKIQHLLRSTNNNIESQNTEYATDCLHAYAISWEQEAIRKLFPGTSEDERAKFFFRHDFKELLRGDSAARSTYYREMRNVGAINANEIREAEDMDPYENGDAYLVQGAMTTIERCISGANFGAGKTEAPPKEKTKEEKASAFSKIAENHEILLADVFTRALKIESERVLKAAKKPDFEKFKTEFYTSHADYLTAGIRSIMASLCEIGAAFGFEPMDSNLETLNIVMTHCERSKNNLSPSTVDAAVLGWNETRAKNYAADIIMSMKKFYFKG